MRLVILTLTKGALLFCHGKQKTKKRRRRNPPLGRPIGTQRKWQHTKAAGHVSGGVINGDRIEEYECKMWEDEGRREKRK